MVHKVRKPSKGSSICSCYAYDFHGDFPCPHSLLSQQTPDVVYEKFDARVLVKRKRAEPADEGRSCRPRLESPINSIANAILECRGPSFLTLEQSQSARAAWETVGGEGCKKHMIAYLAPIFAEKLLPVPARGGGPYILVNCEQYPWLRKATGDRSHLFPDQFIAPSYLVEILRPYENAPNASAQNYGKLASHRCMSSLRGIFAARTNVDDAAIDDLASYLIAASWCDDHKIEQRGFVYDAELCVLMTAVDGKLTDVKRIRWTDEGSLDFIRNYLSNNLPTDTWDMALHEVLAHYGATLSPLSMSTDALMKEDASVPRLRNLLGAGRCGRVFRVMWKGEELAMKLVHGEQNCEKLVKEFCFIDDLPEQAARAYVPVLPDSLMKDHLQPVNQPDFFVAAVEILLSLSDLHAAGIEHGDARYANVVKVCRGPNYRDEYRWIDFRKRSDPSRVKYVADVQQFFSCLKRFCDPQLIENYASAIRWRRYLTPSYRYSAVMELWDLSEPLDEDVD
eukprot:gene35322-42800_t